MARKKSLGRDPFEDPGVDRESRSVEKLIKAKASGGAGPKEVRVEVRLTPSNLKHLDAVRAELERAGRGRYTRDELIRIAVALLTAGDVRGKDL